MKVLCPTPRSLPCPAPLGRRAPSLRIAALAGLFAVAGCGSAEDRSVIDDPPSGAMTGGETLSPPGLPLTGGQTGSETFPACEVLSESDAADTEQTLLGFSAESLIAPFSDRLSGDFRWQDGAVSPAALTVSRAAGSSRVRELAPFGTVAGETPDADDASLCESLLLVPVVMHLSSDDDRIDDSFEFDLTARAVDDAVGDSGLEAFADFEPADPERYDWSLGVHVTLARDELLLELQANSSERAPPNTDPASFAPSVSQTPIGSFRARLAR